MIEIFKKRPFKTRNADEYNLSDVLSLFVNPISGLSSPFDFENSIIKGRMGSGKTMYLRANYAFYLFNLVPNILEKQELILPVFIKLSDFQHITEPSNIYRSLIIKIIEELSSIYLTLQDAKSMANIHEGMKKVKDDLYFEEKIRATSQQLLELGSEEYIKKLNIEFGIQSKLSYSFLEASANFTKNEVVEIKSKRNPGINDVTLAFETLLKDTGGKILLLIDEAGSLDKKFFRKGEESTESFFEVFMNQLRTSEYIRTKVAVYPNSYSDILTETRYGDIVVLEESIESLEKYTTYRTKVESIIKNYLNIDFESEQIKIEEVFECKDISNGDTIEELINGSGGNYRRLIQLLDSAMNESYKRNKGLNKVEYLDAVTALKKHCEDILNSYSTLDKEYLFNLGKVCKNRSTYRFKFPYNAQLLYKYMNRSQEFNLVKVVDAGSGRKGTTYEFDYSYCVYNDIPTHYISGTEKINKKRTLKEGSWISRITNINQEILAQSQIPNKLEGEIFDVVIKGKGYIKGEDSVDYFFTSEFIIESDVSKKIYPGRKVRFVPTMLIDTKFATEIEIL
ncbi:hypothetical protein POV27_07295 [Aureisphaera galaxeae]|uniref:hypothetical protein n=1 Tax=Aureisphaera galaxeae TaxID=1538023 RepID=UPI002350BCF1|nr:hypothetical protein [Aureisphaera galaxeae]MDC8003851.1 hypothetical protein [Aureisphaera galaxeae]